MAYEVQDFQEDVLARSHEIPVLVDFWAPWCGPCRVLGPVLESLAAEQADRWVLVKVNTDAHPDLSSQYGIRGIPAVKLFVAGTVVDEFTGALPEFVVRQWLEKALPSENKNRLREAETAIDAGDRENAETLLRAVLADEEGNAAARVLLARLRLFDDPDEASRLIKGPLDAEPHYLYQAEAIRTLSRLLTLDSEALPDGTGSEAYRAALEALAAHDFDTALSRFIEVIQQNRGYDDDGARKACLALFALLGEQHDTTRRHRRQFDMALY